MESEGKREASEERTRAGKRHRKIRARLALLARFALAFQKKTTLVMLAKKSLGKLKATLLKKNLKKKLLVIEVQSSCRSITKITYFFIYN